MEPGTIFLTIATIFLTKALEKTGEIFSETTISKMGAALAEIRQHSPETALALETGDEQVLKIAPSILVQFPTAPIY